MYQICMQQNNKSFFFFLSEIRHSIVELYGSILYNYRKDKTIEILLGVWMQGYGFSEKRQHKIFWNDSFALYHDCDSEYMTL